MRTFVTWSPLSFLFSNEQASHRDRIEWTIVGVLRFHNVPFASMQGVVPTCKAQGCKPAKHNALLNQEDLATQSSSRGLQRLRDTAPAIIMSYSPIQGTSLVSINFSIILPTFVLIPDSNNQNHKYVLFHYAFLYVSIVVTILGNLVWSCSL